MKKHGNQLFPEDKVVEARNGVKIANARTGKLVNIDPDTRMAEVEWDRDHVETVSLDNLERA